MSIPALSPAGESLPATVERSTRILDHITVALGVFGTALVLILAALQIARWLTPGGA